VYAEDTELSIYLLSYLCALRVLCGEYVQLA